MDSTYRPQSPDLSAYAPQSPDLSGLRPHTPEVGGSLPSPRYGGFGHQYSHSRDRFGGSFGKGFSYAGSPTSVPATPAQYGGQPQPQMASTHRQPPHTNYDDDEYLPDASPRRSRRAPPLKTLAPDGTPFNGHSQLTAPLQDMSTQQQQPDSSNGVQLKTSFPVARIKRIMQADEDIGKVAQVTPHVVSRALELFMIKLIAASATQAAAGGGAGGKGPKRIVAQHMKRAIMADPTFDFLADIVEKVPEAPTKGKKDAAGSDSEDGGAGAKVPRRKGRRKNQSGDDV